jgi:mono/diheme cytochrome c family protein
VRRTGNRGLGAATALALAAMIAASVASAEQATPSLADNAAQIQQGRALYERLCSHCHGFNMVTPGTVAYDLREFPHDAKTRFVDSVTHGKNNRMPPWGDMLSPEQIDEIWAYVRSGGKS